MAGIDFLDGDELQKLIRRIERLERAAPVGFSTVSRGALVVKSPEGLIVEGSEKVTGALEVTGTLTVTGALNADGTITLSGPVSITGATSVTGDMSVGGGGKVKVGTAMTLDPTISSGAMVFSNGAQIFTDGTSVQVFKGGCAVQVTSSEVKMTNGGNTVSIDSAGTHLYGLSQVSGVSSNLYRDPTTGVVKRIV